jgi:hypothetical protein
MTSLPSRYTTTATTDGLQREVARRQLRRLTSARDRSAPRATGPRSRWTHVPLADLFATAGNRVYPRANGHQESGHEPCHASKSGRCVEIDPARGYWWCRGCRQGGDAVRAVMSLNGVTYPVAVARLVEIWGTPAGYWRRDAAGGHP